MCGLSGLVQPRLNPALSRGFIDASARCLARRGPDGFVHQTIDDRIVLTHARLAIIDLAGGTQPMTTSRGTIVFNGEIYNYADLKMPEMQCRSHSDTEVLLNGVAMHGTAWLNQADGMFAFALYQPERRRLTLARDRFGIKPLYYFFDGKSFAFASTLHPLMLLSRKEIDRNGMVEYYLSRAAHAPRTLFADIHEVQAGEYIEFDLGSFKIAGQGFWAEDQPAERIIDDEATAIAELDEAFHLAVRRHLVSDVPVATLLSGGVDSSLLTAIAAKYNPDVSAFSIGFSDARFDESHFASRVARRYNIRHHVRYCDSREFLLHLESWPLVMDDAVADPSAVMLYVVSQLCRDTGFKVALSGEGADEFFGGYNQYYRFTLAQRIAKIGQHMPFLVDMVRRAKKGQSRYVHFARTATVEPTYAGTSMIFEPYLLSDFIDDSGIEIPKARNLSEALANDQKRRLPDDMLTRTDRATMNASIEARVPFLTSYVHKAAGRLSERLLINGKVQKYALKKLAERYVPHECLYRRKVGFDLPLSEWILGPLKNYVTDTLENSWQNEYLRPGAIESVLGDHLSGRNDNADKIWAMVMLEANVKALKAIDLHSPDSGLQSPDTVLATA